MELGSTFALSLPRVNAMAEKEEAAPEPEDAPWEEGDERILVIEGNVESGRFFMQILHDLGFATVVTPVAEAPSFQSASTRCSPMS